MRRAVALVAWIPLALVASCSTSTAPNPVSASRSSAPDSISAFHQAHLAKGESEALAALIVDVPAYGGYADAALAEVQHASTQLDTTFVSGFSLHGVLDADGKEIAFLQLYELSSEVPSDASDAEVLRVFVGQDIAPATTLSRQRVYFLEDPSDPDSQYKYAWRSGNVVTGIDSGNRDQLLAWVRAYLMALSQAGR